jgi:hypothetical protein
VRSHSCSFIFDLVHASPSPLTTSSCKSLSLSPLAAAWCSSPTNATALRRFSPPSTPACSMSCRHPLLVWRDALTSQLLKLPQLLHRMLRSDRAQSRCRHGPHGPFRLVGWASTARPRAEISPLLFIISPFSEIIYSFKYSRNSFKLPKFVEISRNLRKMQIKSCQNPCEQFYTVNLTMLLFSQYFSV